MSELSSSARRELSIIGTVAVIVALPFYIYGIYQFQRQKDQIIIQNRFPGICKIIAVTSFLTGIVVTLRFWVLRYHDGIMPNVSIGFGFLAYGLANVRLCLVILRHQQSQGLLKQWREMAGPVVQHSWQRFRIHRHPLPIANHALNVCGFLTLLVCGTVMPHHNNIVYPVCWMAQFCLSAALLIFTCRNKVSDGIGCLKETCILLAFAFLVSIVESLQSINDEFRLAQMCLNIVFALLQGLIPIYGGLYLVRKRKLFNAKISDELQHPLHVFLQKFDNYAMLRDYLSHCWALENLLFLQSVCILNQIVHRCKHQSAGTAGTVESGDDGLMTLKFDFLYLTNVYKEYEAMIDVDAAKTQFEDMKETIHRAHAQIYADFVAPGSKNEINISYSTRQVLVWTFTNTESINKFQSIDDFLLLYADAAAEVLKMISSVYIFGFSSFIQKNASSQSIGPVALAYTSSHSSNI